MDHVKVLKRSWEILWRYRVLWVFGLILALTAGGGGGDQGMRWTYDGNDPDLSQWIHMPELPPNIVANLIAVGLGLACVAIILTVARFVFHYIAQTALIRMVDDHEETGEKRGVRQGFRLGWSRTTLRVFVIDLLTRLPGMLALFLLFLLGLAVFALIMLTQRTVVLMVIGVVAAIGLGFLIILMAILVSLAASLLRQFFWRVCALEETGVIDSIRQGFSFVRQHLADAIVMWLIMVGLEIGWVIVMIPTVLFLLVIAAVFGGLPALLVGGLASLVFEETIAWVLAALVGLPIFIVVMAAPLVFLGALAEVFKSNVWTLTYRELRALERVASDVKR
jgi:hypothetical protein